MNNKKLDLTYLIVFTFLFFGVAFIMINIGLWPTSSNPYNSYAIQANAWLSGHLNLPDGANYTWLELAIYKGEYFVSFPPFPSFVMLPFALIFGTNTPDHLIALAIYGVAAFYSIRLYQKVRGTSNTAFVLIILLLLGCNTLFVSINGYVWFLAQNMAFTLTLMAFYYAKCKKCSLSLVLLAFAVGCRPMQALYFPVLAYILYQEYKKDDSTTTILTLLRRKWMAAIPTLVTATVYMLLNYLRFGNILEFGHNYLPEFTEATNGQFSTAYLADNLGNMFRLPKIVDGTVDFFYFNGFAFWLVSPIFLLVLVAAVNAIYQTIKRKNTIPAKQTKLTKPASTAKPDIIFLVMCLAIMVIHILCICLHKTLGGLHFGNRYTNDLLPMAYFLTLLYFPKNKKWLILVGALLVFGIILNFYGTIDCYNTYFNIQ